MLSHARDAPPISGGVSERSMFIYAAERRRAATHVYTRR
jgi:hypothetical protein